MKKNSERIRKPNAFLYEATLLGFRIYNKFAYHLKVVRNETKNHDKCNRCDKRCKANSSA